MTDQIVSVRMPSALVDELRDIVHKNHYLDVSELIRSLLRERWMQQKDPEQFKAFLLRQSMGELASTEQIEALKKTIKLLEGFNDQH